MKRIHFISVVFISFCLFGCGTQDDDGIYEDIKTDQIDSNFDENSISIDYEVLNTPKVNEIVLVNLVVDPADKTETIHLNYQIMINEDLKFNENQLQDIKISPKSDGSVHEQQISLIPLRKGRVFFVVSATINYKKKTVTKTLSIPLNVS